MSNYPTDSQGRLDWPGWLAWTAEERIVWSALVSLRGPLGERWLAARDATGIDRAQWHEGQRLLIGRGALDRIGRVKRRLKVDWYRAARWGANCPCVSQMAAWYPNCGHDWRGENFARFVEVGR